MLTTCLESRSPGVLRRFANREVPRAPLEFAVAICPEQLTPLTLLRNSLRPQSRTLSQRRPRGAAERREMGHVEENKETVVVGLVHGVAVEKWAAAKWNLMVMTSAPCGTLRKGSG